MLLRDDRQMAVSDVETLCIEAAERYAAAAVKAHETALAGLFAELAQEHRQFAAELARHIRASGDLPQPPDPDKEAVAEMLTGLKGLLRGDVHDTLIDERERAEQALAGAARAALQHAHGADLQALLQAILAHAESVKGRLAALRA